MMLTARRDLSWSCGARANDTRFALGLAASAKRLGHPFMVASALVATDGLARLAGQARVAATERIKGRRAGT